jgi:hypothetical protein
VTSGLTAEFAEHAELFEKDFSAVSACSAVIVVLNDIVFVTSVSIVVPPGVSSG